MHHRIGQEGISLNPYRTNGIPLEAQYLYRRGREMADRQNDPAARVFFRQAVLIAPGFSKAYQELENCLERLGCMEDAAEYHQKASRINRGPIHIRDMNR